MYQSSDFGILDRPVSMPARDGEILFEKGDPCRTTLEVCRGVARAVAYSREGDRQIMAFFFAGDFIGLPLLQTHRYSAEAVGGLRFTRHSTQFLRTGSALQDPVHPDLFVDAVWREEKAFIARSLILGRVGMRARAAAFLDYLGGRLEVVDGMLNLSIPQGDMASYLATSPETMCRTLRSLRDEQIISMPSRSRLKILDEYRLKMAAEGD